MYRWSSSESQAVITEQENDHIGGIVTEVVDGNTFVLQILEEDFDNMYEYGETEVVQIYGHDAPNIHTREGRDAYEDLYEEIEGEDVVVEVLGRNEKGHLIGIYEIC